MAVWDNRDMAARPHWLLFVFLGIVAAGGVAAAIIWRPVRAPVELATGAALTPPRRLGDFSLIDSHGHTFGAANLRGHWSLLFFGYTHCPDFCPATLATLAAVQKRLRADHVEQLPQVIFVSVDAKRDTPEQLARYVPYFDPDFIGLTAADQPAIEALAKSWGVAVIVEPAKDGGYVVDHSGEIFMLDPTGKIAAILTGPFNVDALQGDVRRMIAGGV
jgi:protein SCO1/2